jgi:molybdopterin converting factor small subunit
MSDEFDEDLDEELEESEVDSKTPSEVASKTPAPRVAGDDLSVFFMSTIGPGEKKQKLLVNTGNTVGDIKRTVGSMFGVSPSDFHLSHGGITMDDGNYLKDYPVKDGDTILLIPASTAGIF